MALCVLGCVALVSPQAALAQKRTPTPSGEELRKSYPLHPAPRPATTPAPRPSLAPAGSRRDAPEGWIGGRLVLALLAGPGMLALLWLVRRRQTHLREARAREARPAPDGDAAVPPDPRRAWTAEIQWRPRGSRFSVVARDAPDGVLSVVAESSPLEWPPADVAAVEALTAAADGLAESLIAAGWRPLENGGAWYARRFAWTPADDGRGFEARRQHAGARAVCRLDAEPTPSPRSVGSRRGGHGREP